MDTRAVARRLKKSVSHTYRVLAEDGPPPRDVKNGRRLYALEDVLFWRRSRAWYAPRKKG